MLQHNPEPPQSDEEYDDGSDYASDSDYEDGKFPLTRDEIVTTIKDFYEFLVRMYIPETALKLPLAEGWPNITAEATANWGKSEFVVDIVRNLPYIAKDKTREDNRHIIDFKCIVQDYSTWTAEDFGREEPGEIVAQLDEEETAREHWLVLAWGYKSFGKYLLLNTENGHLVEEVVRIQRQYDDPFSYYWEELKAKYERLEIVPIPGEESGVGENEIVVDLTEPPLVQEDFLPTVLDVQWVQKLYRDHGWPGKSYDKVAALNAIEDYTKRRNAARS